MTLKLGYEKSLSISPDGTVVNTKNKADVFRILEGNFQKPLQSIVY